MPADICRAHIEMSETRRYEGAPVSTERGPLMMPDVRNNDRVMVDDAELSERVYADLELFVPPRFKKKWRPVGLNDRWRFYRYDPGQQFDWHHDGYYERENGERSFFTFLIYLNDDFEGGGTSFRDDGWRQRLVGRLSVRPETGMALMFHHPILHRGDAVISGRKYVMRTDVMFARRHKQQALVEQG